MTEIKTIGSLIQPSTETTGEIILTITIAIDLGHRLNTTKE